MVATKLAQTLLYVPDVEVAAAFYERVFGLSEAVVDPEGIYIALEGGGATLAFADAEWVARNGLRFAPIEAEARPPAIEVNFFVEDVDGVYRAAIEAGATPWFPPAPQPWGQVVSYVRDPSGFLVEIASFPPKPAVNGGGEELRGQCHCGNLSVRLSTSHPVSAMVARACSCTFCRPRHLRWTSDPEGHVELAVRDVRELSRYRFGTETADFLVCRHCGQVVAAVTLDADARAVVNVDVLERSADFPEAEARDFDGEDVASRLARRSRGWMPATVAERRQ